MFKKNSSLFLKIIFRLWWMTKRIPKLIIKHSKDKRPSSYPYISGDGFRKIADHIYEGFFLNFDASKIKEGDIVFVANSYLWSLRYYFKFLHPEIKVKYKLITHNGDVIINETFVDFLDDKIIKWYAQNVDIKHEKIIPIPIGLENLSLYANGIKNIFNRQREKIDKINKKNRILYGFSPETNLEERLIALRYIEKNNLADKHRRLIPELYVGLLSKYKFVLSPPGNGLDCHRTWEALYLGVVPIVKKTVMTEYFFELGLPLLLVDDWREIENLDSDFLQKKYDEFKCGFDKNKIFIEYWIKKIKL